MNTADITRPVGLVLHPAKGYLTAESHYPNIAQPVRSDGGSPWHSRSAISRRISKPKPPKARSSSTTGSAIPGRAVLAPQGFHAGLHHRARLHGQAQAGIRQARRQDHRPVGRPGRQTTRSWAADIKETQGFAPNYPMIGDTDFKVSKLYGMLPASASGDLGKPHAGRQPDGAQRLRHRPGQEDQARSWSIR